VADPLTDRQPIGAVGVGTSTTASRTDQALDLVIAHSCGSSPAPPAAAGGVARGELRRPGRGSADLRLAVSAQYRFHRRDGPASQVNGTVTTVLAMLVPPAMVSHLPASWFAKLDRPFGLAVQQPPLRLIGIAHVLDEVTIVLRRDPTWDGPALAGLPLRSRAPSASPGRFQRRDASESQSNLDRLKVVDAGRATRRRPFTQVLQRPSNQDCRSAAIRAWWPRPSQPRSDVTAALGSARWAAPPWCTRARRWRTAVRRRFRRRW
jgi:hypothetical protein